MVELMRRPLLPEVEKQRISGPAGEPYGQFVISGPVGFDLRCQASAGEGWEHVSVSLPNRCPNWVEMDFVKRMFWRDDEVVMQLHISDDRKVDRCKTCLHLWRPMTIDENLDEKERWVKGGEIPPSDWAQYHPIPLPPRSMV